ncbi:hypothetical protein RMCBS344292_19402 [Rhizopus microsporus]|nr:hypothetical protein RMCBS344292_19402 [Rhizopus microsporus]
MPVRNYYRSELLNKPQGSFRKDRLTHEEQQLREEIARLKREEQELKEKDYLLKQHIEAVREELAATTAGK